MGQSVQLQIDTNHDDEHCTCKMLKAYDVFVLHLLN